MIFNLETTNMRTRGFIHFSDFFSRHRLLVFFVDFLIIIGLIFLLSAKSVSFANSDDETFPYKACYTITAYYSPLPDQQRYGRGSYEAEVIFEGRGTHAADGTPVYPGMLAAPPEIPFGTKIHIPGIGIGTIHDRGGAIQAGSGCTGRLDAWMGYGEEGLERALNWGMRKVEVTFYGIDETIEEDIILEGYSETEKILREKIPFLSPQIFQRDLGLGDSGDDVKRLQKHLIELDYFEGEETGLYDDDTQNAVLGFQLYYGIVSSSDDLGAGYFGVNTRKKIDFAIKTFDENTHGKFTYGLGLGSYGREVRRLQKYLVKLGYLDRDFVTSEYDKNSEKAVLKFQLDNGVINSSADTGSGYFGPKTRSAFNERLSELDVSPISLIFEDLAKVTKEINVIEEEIPEEEELEVEEEEMPEVSDEVLAKYPDLQEDYDLIREGLAIGDTGEDVRKLQEELHNLGYLRIEPTGYFGPITSHAVFKLQQNWELVEDKNSFGAGYVGPQTAGMFNDIIDERVRTKGFIAAKREDIFIAKMKETPVAASEAEEIIAEVKKSELEAAAGSSRRMIAEGSSLGNEEDLERTLKYGDRGEDVKELQKKLRKLGFFKGFLLTEYFGDITKEAVIAFQISNGIIGSEDDEGAGVVGSETRKKLMG